MLASLNMRADAAIFTGVIQPRPSPIRRIGDHVAAAVSRGLPYIRGVVWGPGESSRRVSGAAWRLNAQ